MKQNDTLTRAKSLSRSAALALLVVGCGGAAAPDFRVLRAAPIMSEAVQAEATRRSKVAECIDQPLDCELTVDEVVDYIWATDAFGDYIDELREGAE
jgi:hypothetical protein